ncbi:uncharacterized protein DEA37_0011582 [Paragonimus westermani]|uniref:Uncharacterized protein n=1 Tax=Paragonimus westermani TaxID=34504 RepID=A0A5J4NQI6_9TREM|nr:uncharacterized protein DEA37_0011582 [Paragonimus westermani]
MRSVAIVHPSVSPFSGVLPFSSGSRENELECLVAVYNPVLFLLIFLFHQPDFFSSQCFSCCCHPYHSVNTNQLCSTISIYQLRKNFSSRFLPFIFLPYCLFLCSHTTRLLTPLSLLY